MDISKLTRVKGIPKTMVVQENGTIIAGQDCSIVFPKRWLEGTLGFTDDYFNVCCYFALVVDDKYWTCSLTGMLPFTPESTDIFKVGNETYIALNFGVGSVMCPNANVVMNNSILQSLYAEFHEKGKTPWYFDRGDLCRIFDTAEEYTNTNLGTNHAILELFTAIRARSPEDKKVFIRNLFKKQEDVLGMDAAMIPLDSIGLGTSSTIASIGGGSWFNEGLNRVLTSNPGKLESFEEKIIT